MFLLDSSASVSIRDFQDEITFTKSLATYLQLFSGKSRVSVISYGSYARPVAEYRTPKEFNKSVDIAPYINGKRRIDLALEKSLEIFRQGVYPQLTKILVLLTAGDSSLQSKDLKSVFEPLRELGIKHFIFGIGRNIDKKKLLQIVDKPNDFKEIQSFKDLSKGNGVYENILIGMLHNTFSA